MIELKYEIDKIQSDFDRIHSLNPDFGVTISPNEVPEIISYGNLTMSQFHWDDGKYLIKRLYRCEVQWIISDRPLVSDFYRDFLGDPVPEYMDVLLISASTMHFGYTSNSSQAGHYSPGSFKFDVPVENAREFFKNFKRCYELSKGVKVF